MKPLLTWLGERWIIPMITGLALLAVTANAILNRPSTTDRTLAYISQCQNDIARLGKATQVKSMDETLRDYKE